MKAELKAKELVLRHYEKVSGVTMTALSKMVQFFNTDSHWKTAIDCALITVDEILKLDVPVMIGQDSTPFWQQVKAELEKM